MLLGPLVSIASKKKMGINPMNVNTEEDLRFLLELNEKGRLSPVIDRRVDLSEVPEALRDLSEGLVKGKVAVTVGHDDNHPGPDKGLT
jgi:NADPH:quinone reductase-like Zn-dependent oxidoreductase